MAEKDKKTRWEYLGIKPEVEEKKLKEKFDIFISGTPKVGETDAAIKLLEEEKLTKTVEEGIEKEPEKKEPITEIRGTLNTLIKTGPPFIMKWFQGSYLRMYFGLTFIWCYFLFLFLFSSVGKGNPEITTANIILAPLVIGIGGALYMLLLSAGPLGKLDEKWRQSITKSTTGWVALARLGFIVIPYYVYGWIPQKAYEWYFYKFSNLHIGRSLYVEGKYKEAIAELDRYKVSKYNPIELFTYYLLLGDCYTGVGEYNKAISSYQNVNSCDPYNVSAQKRLALAYILNTQHNEGLSILREIHKQNQEDTEVLGIMARSYIMLRMYDDAFSHLMGAISLEPMDPIYHKMLAEVYLDKGMNEKAIESAHKSLSLNPPQDVAEEAEAIIKICKKFPEEMVSKDYLEVSNNIFCTQCGGENPLDAAFCMECGQKLG